ncbi:tRNA(adenine34) deaminase [Ectothiorhodospira magna]|uniref:tRNA-specific adenosine deaminase n=1 Tax=Ectothiorhodospira magna TaxID=867345 RepID=A0A1H9EF12_9GAMM|nr:tRNA adenosine(34) deaminase TadA [Ectothiorhodospira magna]SEQ24172.1 tRNA(adenine34) deaminase [Ectothiorhodospira magna]
MATDPDIFWMEQALALAAAAAEQGEVPVGAVLVRDGICLGRGMNRPVALHDPTAHAEILALREAALQEGNYRLPGTTLYVTLEPCIMCLGAIMQARVARLVFGAHDPKTGVLGGAVDALALPVHHHGLEVRGGVLAQAGGDCLRAFFRARRGRGS